MSRSITLLSKAMVRCQIFVLRSKIQNFRNYLLQKFNDENMLTVIKIILDPIVVLPETSRNSFMGTIKVHLFWMEMSTWLAEQGRPTQERHLLSLELD